MARYDHLVLVPGHAVWNLRGDPELDENWFLKPYQNREPHYFIEHIRAGVECAAADDSALLLFSGAATDRTAWPVSEALGYWSIAEWYGWWGREAVRGRALLEEYALDSFQNLDYGLRRFAEAAGAPARRVTVCGWGFKRHRIADLHAAALSCAGLEYVAVNDPPNLAEVLEREACTCAEFEADPRGERPPISTKREARRPDVYPLPYG